MTSGARPIRESAWRGAPPPVNLSGRGLLNRARPLGCRPPRLHSRGPVARRCPLEARVHGLVPEERFHGCLLGQAVGDALGAPYEGLPADFVFWTLGPVSELV